MTDFVAEWGRTGARRVPPGGRRQPALGRFELAPPGAAGPAPHSAHGRRRRRHDADAAAVARPRAQRGDDHRLVPAPRRTRLQMRQGTVAEQCLRIRTDPVSTIRV